MASLIDEVEAKVALAQRDFSRSQRVISSAREDLESLQRRLDHYRSAWTNELTLALRSLKQRRVISTCKRLTLGLLLLPSFVVFGIFRGAIWTLLCARDLLAGGLWRFSNCARLREHICKLGGSFRGKRVAETQEQRFSNPIGRSLALRVDAKGPDLVHSSGQGSYYLQMICGVYAVLGLYLIAAATDPSKNRSLISFTIWSSVVHAAIMGTQALSDSRDYGHLVGDVPALFLIAAVLWLLSPKGERFIGATA